MDDRKHSECPSKDRSPRQIEDSSGQTADKQFLDKTKWFGDSTALLKIDELPERKDNHWDANGLRTRGGLGKKR